MNIKESTFDYSQHINKAKIEHECYCTLITDHQSPHQFYSCKKKTSACSQANALQHKVALQALEIQDLKHELQLCKAELQQQKLELKNLNDKYIAGMEQVAYIQQQKNQADCEIEELSTKLFEEANVMVANERKKSTQLEKLLQRTEDQLQVEQGQLRELKNRIESIVNLPQTKINAYKHNTELKDATVQLNNIEPNKHKKSHSKSFSVSSLSAIKISQSERSTSEKPRSSINCPVEICIDASLSSIRLFQSYIDQSKAAKIRKSSVISLESNKMVSTESIMSLSQQDITKDSEFIQLCEKEDIEPCLQFGISSSRMCTKTMMECMMRKPCFIESITLREARRMRPAINSSAIYRPFWERLTTISSPDSNLENIYIECAACKRQFHILQYLDQTFYRFRLEEQDDWLLIDKACRNRLVAVCNFYSFLRNIQLGYYQGSSLKDLYTYNIQLRMQIFYSRVFS